MRLVRLPVQEEQGRPVGNIFVVPTALEHIQIMDDQQCIIELTRSSIRIAASGLRVAQEFERALTEK